MIFLYFSRESPPPNQLGSANDLNRLTGGHRHLPRARKNMPNTVSNNTKTKKVILEFPFQLSWKTRNFSSSLEKSSNVTLSPGILLFCHGIFLLYLIPGRLNFIPLGKGTQKFVRGPNFTPADLEV